MRFGRQTSDREARGDVTGALSDEPRGRGWLGRIAACAVVSVAIAMAAWSSASSPPQSISLAATAVGGSSTTAPSNPTQTTVVTTSTTVSASTTSTPAPTTTSTTAAAKAAAVSTADVCTAAKSYVDRLRRLSVSLTDPQKVPGLLAGVSATDRAVTAAPAEVQKDLSTVAAAIDDTRADLEAAGYAPRKLRPDVLMRLTSPDVVMAIGRIEAWAQNAC